MANNGFYVTDSLSKSYIDNMKNESGGNLWNSASDSITRQTSAALQDLNTQYSQTINNAYSSYLAAQANLGNSALGQGYKEAYLQDMQNELSNNMVAVNTSVASARANLLENQAEGLAEIQASKEQQIDYTDRALRSYQDYYDYIKGLDTDNILLSKDDKTLDVDYMYDKLNELAIPDILREKTGAMSYAEWFNKNLSDSAADTAYRKWYYQGGGYDTVRDMISNTAKNREDLIAQRNANNDATKTELRNLLKKSKLSEDKINSIVENVIARQNASTDTKKLIKLLKMAKVSDNEINKIVQAVQQLEKEVK